MRPSGVGFAFTLFQALGRAFKASICKCPTPFSFSKPQLNLLGTKRKTNQMKTIISNFVVILTISIFLGCSSDSDTSPTPTPCIPITCLNGGTSTPNCGCTCPQGYSGLNCQTQVQPTKITITKIRVTSFPNTTSSGAYWDSSFPNVANVYADIRVSLKDGNLNEIYGSGYFANVLSNGTNYYDFTPTTPINITSVNSFYTIDLLDYDGASSNTILTSDEFMATSVFNIYTATGGFPTTLTLVGSSTFRAELTLSYTW